METELISSGVKLRLHGNVRHTHKLRIFLQILDIKKVEAYQFRIEQPVCLF